MRPPRTRFAGPLKGALPVAWQSQFHGSHLASQLPFASLITRSDERGFR
jgi:hypothetical protein